MTDPGRGGVPAATLIAGAEANGLTSGLMRAIRYALALFAVVAVAWFVIGARQAHDVDAATTLLNYEAGHSAAGSRHTESLLSSADFLYPGVDVTLLRARLAMEQYDWAKAKPFVDQATAAEPDNLTAWIYALDLKLKDPSTVDTEQLLAHLRMLDPVDARSFGR